MSSPRPHILITLGLAVLTLVCLGKVCKCAFIYLDDPMYVTENTFVPKGLTWPTCVEAITRCDVSYWQPMTWLSLQLDATLGDYENVARQAHSADMLARKEGRPTEK